MTHAHGIVLLADKRAFARRSLSQKTKRDLPDPRTPGAISCPKEAFGFRPTVHFIFIAAPTTVRFGHAAAHREYSNGTNLRKRTWALVCDDPLGIGDRLSN